MPALRTWSAFFSSSLAAQLQLQALHGREHFAADAALRARRIVLIGRVEGMHQLQVVADHLRILAEEVAQRVQVAL